MCRRVVKVSSLSISELITIVKGRNTNNLQVNEQVAMETLADAYLEKCEELKRALEVHGLVGRI